MELAEDFSTRIYSDYDNYRERSIVVRDFKHLDILPLIKSLRKKPGFSLSGAGTSAEGRDIYLIALGHGKKNILLWSQMHGDESTATMALFDIFNFFSTRDKLDEIKAGILEKVTLNFIPMLNPDGAERFQRHNAYDIDLNRDALRLECPESKILKSIHDKLKAKFGFNLHDQNPHYSAGHTFKTASISFLAPPFNHEKKVNPVRERAMKLIVEMTEMLNKFIPGHIGKYPDDFEPRAFGDNIQKWGTSTILIESGGWKHDTEKQFLRKINFITILSAIKFISEDAYEKQDIQKYYGIPENKEIIFDLLLREVTVYKNGEKRKIDIGINRTEVRSGGKLFFESIIADIGDLSTFFGNEEYLCNSMQAFPGLDYPSVIESFEELKNLKSVELFSRGITVVPVNKKILPEGKYTKFPFIIKSSDYIGKNDFIALNSVPNFLLKLNNEIRYIIINGFVYDLAGSTNNIQNGLIAH
ncbi:MAG: M14 family zinc carboxypeptidase [Ignavibacteria bacterium]